MHSSSHKTYCIEQSILKQFQVKHIVSKPLNRELLSELHSESRLTFFIEPLEWNNDRIGAINMSSTGVENVWWWIQIEMSMVFSLMTGRWYCNVGRFLPSKRFWKGLFYKMKVEDYYCLNRVAFDLMYPWKQINACSLKQITVS